MKKPQPTEAKPTPREIKVTVLYSPDPVRRALLESMMAEVRASMKEGTNAAD